MLCDDVDTVRGLRYLDDRVSAGGGCEAAMAATTRCGFVIFSHHGCYCMERDLF